MSSDNRHADHERLGSGPGALKKTLAPWILIVLMIAGAVFLYVRTESDEQQPYGPRQRPPTAVEVAPVARVTLYDTVRGIGSLRPVQSVEIKSETSGRIKSVHFQEGGYAGSSQLLFEIEGQRHVQRLASSEAALEEARARLENLDRIYQRHRMLFEQGVISENEFDAARTGLEAASAEVRRLEAQVELAKEDLADTSVRAPFSGLISSRLVDPGTFVSPGQPLAVMYQINPLEISFMVPEKYSARVEPGQQATVMVSAHPGEMFEGRVGFVSPSVDESTRRFEVKAAIDNQDSRLKPGSFASVVLILGYRESAMVVPEPSLVATREGYHVFVLDPDRERVVKRPILSGMRRPGLVEVLDGLSFDELVVVSGHMALDHGSRVMVARELGPDWTGLDNDLPGLHSMERSRQDGGGLPR